MNESNSIKPHWTMREYQESDEERIRELREIALSGSRDSHWWKWMYRNGPAGPAIAWIAEAGNKIVGQNAVSLVRMKIGDQACMGTQGFDIMTHPEYQRQGVLTALRVKTRDNLLKKGVSITYGVAIHQTDAIYRRIQSVTVVEEIPTLVKVIDLGKVLKSRYGIPVFAGNLLGNAWERITNRTPPAKNADVEVEQVSSFDEGIDKFWRKASNTKNIMVIKDMKYLNWRYVDKPANEYKIFVAKRQDEITGFIVFKCERGVPNRGFIIDLLTLPGEDTVAETLITRAVANLKAEGAAMISCWMLQDAPYYRTLRRLGFLRRRSGLSLGGYVHDRNLSNEFFTNPGNWYFVQGDTDLI